MTTETEREEALRLAKEAGVYESSMINGEVQRWSGNANAFVKLIRLARATKPAAPAVSAEPIKWFRANTIEDLEAFYESCLPSIRAVARSLGYAIGVHGSMQRDLDLIAVPWEEKHSTPDALAKAIQYVPCGIIQKSFTWEQKPCGRIATAIPICWTEDKRPSAGHIDLSVIDICAQLAEQKEPAHEG